MVENLPSHRSQSQEMREFQRCYAFLAPVVCGTDGEMTEGLVTDTEEILINNSRCFFEGMLGLSKQEMAAFITHYCPLIESGSIVEALKQALENARYRHIAAQLLQQIEGKQCQ